MDHGTLARRVAATCTLSGSFLLRSGQTSDTYFDKYLFEAEPALLWEIAIHTSGLVPDGSEVLAGLELGGVPIATALSLVTGIPTAFVRKVAKTYGTAKLGEGEALHGRHVLVIEDVITTGGQVAASTKALREQGALVDRVLCIIDRSRGTHPELDAAGVSVTSLFTAEELA